MNSKRKSGFFWHVHHDTLLEWCHDIIERINYIKEFKPKNEVKLRLKLLKPVRGRLPIGIRETRKALVEAQRAYNKADRAYCNSNVTTKNACDKAQKVYTKALAAYDEALVQNYWGITELHLKECKRCPWNGVNIFSRKSL